MLRIAKMNAACACRTNSFRTFVQSLTELRVADPAITRAITRPRQLARFAASPFPFHPAPAHHPARLYSSVSTDTENVWGDLENAANISITAPKKKRTGAARRKRAEALREATGDTIQTELPPPVSFTSTQDLETAKEHGAILDLNPESLDKLLAGLNQASGDEPQPAPRTHKGRDMDASSQFQRRPKPPDDMSSQLKRRKIIKEDRPPEPSPRMSQNDRRENWQIQKAALKEKFPEGWNPRKKLSPDALDGIRALHMQYPEQYTASVLSQQFQVSPEAIRRILRAKWTPTAEEEEARQERWFQRGKTIWSHMAALGKKPPRKWRAEGVVRDPRWNVKRGPRTEYPYQPRRGNESEKGAENGLAPESTQRKLSGRLL
ncbi:hypothetical protein F4808DRAFT_418992 [Astrocystis sublimbata]|nr:hypothetical protein F4808DRAFT_418992 [Astrocystis sublimbata]